MHKYRLCSLALEVKIIPDGPILVKSPQEGTVDPAVPDMSFVRTRSPVSGHSGLTVYLPGSSLKGVLRSPWDFVLKSAAPSIKDRPAGRSRIQGPSFLCPSDIEGPAMFADSSGPPAWEGASPSLMPTRRRKP